MRTWNSSTRAAVVLAMAAAMLVSVAGPALASDVVIRELTAVCAEDGTDGIAFAVTTDRTGEAAEHPAIRVEWKPAELDDDAYALLGTGELRAENGHTFSDTVTGLDFGEVARVTVRATALKAADGGGPWGDGRPAGDTYTKTISVEACDDGSDGDARINFTAGCTTAAGEPAVILFNDGTPGEDDPLEFDVEAGVDGHTLRTSRTVDPGTSTTVLLVFTDGDGAAVDTEDTTIEVAVTVADEVHERSVAVDCADEEGSSPEASAEGACGEGAGTAMVELHNPTTAAVIFVVTIDGEVIDTVELSAGTTETRDHEVADGAHLVTVEADGTEVADATVTVDCEPTPSATVTPACSDQAVLEVGLANPDAAPAIFEVRVDGEVIDTVEVADGSVAGTHPVTSGAHDVGITAGDTTVFDDRLTFACGGDVLAATTEITCGTPGGRLVEDVDIDCVDVLGVSETNDPAPGGGTADPVVAGDQLPNTGATTVLWALLALLLLFLGSDLVLSQLHDRWRHLTG